MNQRGQDGQDADVAHVAVVVNDSRLHAKLPDLSAQETHHHVKDGKRWGKRADKGQAAPSLGPTFSPATMHRLSVSRTRPSLKVCSRSRVSSTASGEVALSKEQDKKGA